MLTNLIFFAAFALVGYLLIVLSSARTPGEPEHLRAHVARNEDTQRRR